MSASALSDTLAQTVLHVVVKVNAQGEIHCLPPELVVCAKDALISFELHGEHWAFPDSGAVQVTDGGEDFPYPSWTVHARQAALLDCNAVPGDFNYTVTVENTQTGERRSLDPKIVNES